MKEIFIIRCLLRGHFLTYISASGGSFDFGGILMAKEYDSFPAVRHDMTRLIAKGNNNYLTIETIYR